MTALGIFPPSPPFLGTSRFATYHLCCNLWKHFKKEEEEKVKREEVLSERPHLSRTVFCYLPSISVHTLFHYFVINL